MADVVQGDSPVERSAADLVCPSCAGIGREDGCVGFLSVAVGALPEERYAENDLAVRLSQRREIRQGCLGVAEVRVIHHVDKVELQQRRSRHGALQILGYSRRDDLVLRMERGDQISSEGGVWSAHVIGVFNVQIHAVEVELRHITVERGYKLGGKPRIVVLDDLLIAAAAADRQNYLDSGGVRGTD